MQQRHIKAYVNRGISKNFGKLFIQEDDDIPLGRQRKVLKFAKYVEALINGICNVLSSLLALTN